MLVDAAHKHLHTHGHKQANRHTHTNEPFIVFVVVAFEYDSSDSNYAIIRRIADEAVFRPNKFDRTGIAFIARARIHT